MAVDSRSLSLVLDLIARDAFTAENNAGVVENRLRELSTYTDGVANGSIDLLFTDRRTNLAASANEDIDLAGSLLDVAGTTLTFVQIDVIAVRNRRVTAGDTMTIGPAAANGFGLTGPWSDASDRTIIEPALTLTQFGWVIFTNPRGWPVTAGTGDLINVAETGGANAIDYDLLIAGRSA
jgi:hypothetical protein